MASESPAATDKADNTLTTHDGQPLHKSLAKALRQEKRRAFLLIAPLLLFVLLTFVFPIADMLFRSVENSIVEKTIPGTTRALSTWDARSNELPDEEVFAALADDLMVAQELKMHTRLGSRLNYDQPGIASLFRKTGRRVKKLDSEAHLNAFIASNPAWAEAAAWTALTKVASWPDAFPATQIAWTNWSRFVKSDVGEEASPNEKMYNNNWQAFPPAPIVSNLSTFIKVGQRSTTGKPCSAYHLPLLIVTT